MTGAHTGSSHICWIVDHEPEFAREAQRFLGDARRRGAKTVVFAPHDGRLFAELRPHVDLALDPYVDLLAGGPLDPEAMFAAFRDAVARARDEGYEDLCVVADMDWLRPAKPTTEAVVAFELLLDRLVSELGITVLCAYRGASFEDELTDGVLCVHPEVIARRGPPFSLVSANGTTWRLTGEVDAGSAAHFSTALRTATKSPDVLDVSGLRFIDVAGMRTIAEVSRTAASGIQLRGAAPMLERYWRLAGFDEAAPAVQLVDW